MPNETEPIKSKSEKFKYVAYGMAAVAAISAGTVGSNAIEYNSNNAHPEVPTQSSETVTTNLEITPLNTDEIEELRILQKAYENGPLNAFDAQKLKVLSEKEAKAFADRHLTSDGTALKQ